MSARMPLTEVPVTERWRKLDDYLAIIEHRVSHAGSGIDPADKTKVEDLAEESGVTLPTLIKHLQHAKVPLLKIGKTLWVRKINLISYYEQKEAGML